MMSDLIERNKTITDALTYGTGFIENGKHIPIGDAMKNDLIERMEDDLQQFKERGTEHYKWEWAYIIATYEEAITALREREDEAIKAKDYMVELSATVTSQQARIAELEGTIKQSEICGDFRINRLKEQEAKIEQYKQMIEDMWPLMALKTHWLEKHPEYRELAPPDQGE
jgi:hypothetical protein